MGQRSLELTGRSGKSTGSPSTFSTRPSVSGPTGTEIGPPVSITSMPRVMPSVGFIATARTRFSPRCCSPSATQPTDGMSRGMEVIDTGGGLHRDRAHAVLAQVLLHFRDDIDLRRAAGAVRDDTDGVVDGGKAFGEYDVDHRADDLDDLAGLLF